MAYGWLASLVGGGGGDSSGDSKQGSGILTGKGPTARASQVMDYIDAKKQRRREQEMLRQLRNEQLYNQGQQQAAIERKQDLAPSMLGSKSSDYVTSGMLVPGGRAEIGGAAMENLLNLSSGYNPAVAANPHMSVNPMDRASQASLRETAKANTESTLGSWEKAMADLRTEYDQAAAKQSDRRDEMVSDYREAIEGGREDEKGDRARMIVEAWIDSNDKKGALGNEDFLDRRGARDKGQKLALATVAHGDPVFGGVAALARKFRRRRGKGRRGKVTGADESAKRDYVRDLMAGGMTYEDLLQDPSFREYLEADRNSDQLLAAWDANG